MNPATSNPTRIGKYEIESVIGRGGMGVVYRALDPQLGRQVAIKMIISGGDQELLTRFIQEAKSTGRLQSPNIVTVYDFGEHEGNPYLVMEYIEGASLEGIIKSGVPLTLAEKLGIIIDVCNGLSYAHEQGVIHRDMKPGNIMVLKKDGTAKIVDFGIARIGGSRLTRTDQVIGSYDYMSPEQLQNKHLDHRTDIFSTGVVLYQLLTGELPFRANETAATLYKIVHEAPPPLDLEKFPAELQAALGRALAKDAFERYDTAKDLALDLIQIQDRQKQETIAQYLRRAEAAMQRNEWAKAAEQLQLVLRIDRQNATARRLNGEVQERVRQQQRIEQAQHLRSRAEEAFQDLRYDDALHLLNQAITLDENNSDLPALRQTVLEAKHRTNRLQQVLRRAEAAQQEGDIEEAAQAVDEALAIDPNDTQARALQVILKKQAEEKARQDKLRQLFEEARKQIAARELTKALSTLKIAEAIDPHSPEVATIAKLALAAREQEKRRLETEELRRQVEAALVQEDYATAVAKAEEGLRKFPQEQSLLKLKTLAEAQRTRVEQKKFVREQFAAASSLFDSGEVLQALAVLDGALQKVPGNGELETLRSVVRDRVAAEASEQQKLEAMAAALAEGQRILQERGAQSAKEFLDTHVAQYREFPQVRELYDAVRARDALDVLDGKLAAEPRPARRVQLAEEAAHSYPDNRWIQQRLADLQQVKDQLSAAMDRAQALEAAGDFSGALQQWQQLKRAYPQVSEVEAQISRIASLQTGGKKAKIVPPVPAPPVVPEPPKSAEPAADLSATRMLSSPILRDAEVTSRKSAPMTRETAVVGGAKKAAPLPTRATTPRGLSLPDVQRQLGKFLAGPNKYIVIAVAAVVLLVVSYLLFGGHKKIPGATTATPLQIHIIPSPPDAVVTSGSQPVPNGIVSLVPGTSVTIEVARLGYKTKQVEVRQDSDGKIVLEPEPLRLSIQTSEKSGTVELDGQKIGDLSDGNMDEYDLAPDGKGHKLRVTAQGKQLFTVELQPVPASLPQVNGFDANGLFLITSLGTSAKLYAGNVLKNVRLGDQPVAVSPSGADLSLSEQTRDIKFGQGSEQGSLAIEISNAPTLSVHSINIEGQVEVTANVEEAVLTVDGTSVKRQRHGWLVSRPPGTYNFELSAEGYEPQKWTMALQRRQTFTRHLDLQPKVKAATNASLLITGGTPGAEVEIDGKRAGELDANGNIRLPNALAAGQHSVTFAKPYYESRAFEVSAKPPEVRLPDTKLTPWSTVSFQTTVTDFTVKYQRAGDSQAHQVTATTKLRLPPGQYTALIEAPGFQELSLQMKLANGDDLSIPLKFVRVQDYEFQDATQVTHDGPWIKLQDPHKFVYLKPGLLHENLVFTKPGKNLFWNKKVEWVIEAPEGSASIQYALEGQKMVRKLIVGEQTSDQKEAKVDAAALNQETSLSVHIRVDGSHVQVSNDKGAVLDDYTAPQHNFSGGKIGVRTASLFVVRELNH